MTKRIFLACLLALLPFVSCSVREDDSPVTGEDVLSITLDPGAMGVTRATAYGEDKFNENEIKEFRLYFYADGASDDAEAVYIYPESGFATGHVNGAATVGADAGVDPTTGKVTVRLKLNDKRVDEMFPSLSSCRVYAVANLGENAILPSSTSVNSLKRIVLTAAFGPDATATEEPYAKVQDSFAMDGEGTLTVNKANRSASGEIKMYRAASKITFKVSRVSKDGVEDKDWEPQTDQMRVSFINGVNRGYLNGSMDKKSREGESGEYLFSYKTSDRNYSRKLSGDAESGWTHELPFYSYYNLWRDADNQSNPECGNAPYMLLSLPWKHSTSGRYFTCYYAVPFNTVSGRLDRNVWYQISLSVGILGSGDPDNPTEITPSYMILPWGNEVTTNANLMRYRYLMVDENEYEMHNIDALTIPFFSSHPVEISNAKLTYLNLFPNKVGENLYRPVTEEESNYTCVINDDNQSMTFTHKLNNDYGSGLHVSAYTLTVTLRHIDQPEFNETITIVQYPSLYVRAELNSYCEKPDLGIATNGNDVGHKYTFVNGNNSYLYSSPSNYWYSIYDFDEDEDNKGGSNYDPYMYVVTVSSLPSGSDLIIGDPRQDSFTDFDDFNTTTTDRWGNTSTKYWAESANSIYRGKNVRLAEYYPTRTDSDVENMVAPSFRIASSYGVVLNIGFDDAQKRCASYQEDGYPAGRWRVPTKAEIYYMVMLKTYNKIPELLSPGSYYWGSNKKAFSPTTTGAILESANSKNTHVRCVYDEWYWTDINESNKAKYSGSFIWGDKQK